MSELLANEISPKTIDELLQEDARRLRLQQGELLTFQTADELDIDVYNITAPFEYEGKQLIAGRTEVRTDEAHSVTRFFWHDFKHDTWIHDESLPTLDLQDPFVEKIHKQWIVGGVRVYATPDKPPEVTGWDTQIYSGHDLRHLRPLVVGPYKMKDIRLVELPNGEVAIFTRPQGEKGGVGKVGFTMVSRLGDITTQVLEEAPIIPELFADERNEWGGVNEAYTLGNGLIGVAGHIARHVQSRGNEGLRCQYYPMTFIFNPVTHAVINEQIIARRDCFPDTAAKKPDLKEVAFTGGIRTLGELATWYGGISDTSAAVLPRIPNPFIL
jgi:hypothetical protein